jgi:hypothetical protein
VSAILAAVAHPHLELVTQPFEALHHAELIHPVNPLGDVGVLTLWSPVATARRRLDAVSPDILNSGHGRVAVIANLYGDGMYAMFCNLLFNPQVRHLIAVGEDLGLGACAEIRAFIDQGLEDDTMLGLPVRRIPGTARVFPSDAAFDQDALRRRLTFHHLGRLSGDDLAHTLTDLLDELPRQHAPLPPRVHVHIHEPAAPDSAPRPSEPAAHQVLRRTPLECWEELVVRAVRFGRPVALRSGPRLELLNARALIAEPARDSQAALARYGFDPEQLRDYERAMLDPELPSGIFYTYGNRLRAHFHRADAPLDTIDAVIDELRGDPESRHALISLWDTPLDLPRTHDGERGEHADERSARAARDGERAAHDELAAPCLATLFFRRGERGLTLTATYRSHNLLSAWLRNVYGLMAVQRHVAGALGMDVAQLTVISHSLGLDPRSPRYQLARTLAERWKRDDDRDHHTGKHSLRQDPNGYFVVTVDRTRRRIVAEHRVEGVLVKRYEGERASRIAADVNGDMAVSLVSHAMWLGAALANADRQLAEQSPTDADGQPAARSSSHVERELAERRSPEPDGR